MPATLEPRALSPFLTPENFQSSKVNESLVTTECSVTSCYFADASFYTRSQRRQLEDECGNSFSPVAEKLEADSSQQPEGGWE